MKSLIILILTAALAGAFFITRPTKEDFASYVTRKMAAGADSPSVLLEKGLKAKLFIEECEYKNYFLWGTVYRDQKLIYVGALSHWFTREDFPASWEADKTPAHYN